MLLQELMDRLRAEGIDRSWYSFSRADPPLEGFILEHVGADWAIFFFERGATRRIALFELESDACEWFYEKLRREMASSSNRKII
ncbi:MAG: hypothetical protein JO261_06785 [Alphaproteobacteria bacterium]|nr:hypothetical protein [Alphaproteobacteria bacterium]MBV9693390.1 hypothetical protein [Alphaproteobacteria bacterium]